ncbi:hypothetical protein GE061_020280 [Apolygus lucorum]|uniref:Uncharacterized protein n=1 Tax=Apolygus lucorum TaxID=248454 RepID=A0A6A4IPP3_APOLU|nr:hypothetical protein GE061_020280 [Apolygus lucorum]
MSSPSATNNYNDEDELSLSPMLPTVFDVFTDAEMKEAGAKLRYTLNGRLVLTSVNSTAKDNELLREFLWTDIFLKYQNGVQCLTRAEIYQLKYFLEHNAKHTDIYAKVQNGTFVDLPPIYERLLQSEIAYRYEKDYNKAKENYPLSRSFVVDWLFALHVGIGTLLISKCVASYFL